MKYAVEIDLIPFEVPDHVQVKMPPGKREDGFQEGTKFHLSHLDSCTLDRLCNDFRTTVFQRANKQQPTDCVPPTIPFLCRDCGTPLEITSVRCGDCIAADQQ